MDLVRLKVRLNMRDRCRRYIWRRYAVGFVVNLTDG